MTDTAQTIPVGANAAPDVQVRPTLFIGLGGTGMEVVMRIRHKILASTWGSRLAPVRITGLSEFPVAEFMRFDLDVTGVQTASDQAGQVDIFAAQKEFTEGEKIIQALDTNKYFQSTASMDAYPHIKKWMPLTRNQFLELKIDPREGAGQIRSLSRLYFYDRYPAVRAMISAKIKRLLSNVTNEDSLNRLGLETENSLRIVFVSSCAGGTGSGCFLDMGYLAKILSEETGKKATVELFTVMPSGYAGFGQERTEANGYSALMELETLLSQDVKFVENWEAGARVQQPMRPFDNVYLFDTTNLVGESTSNISDLYDMMSDSLFEDFQSEAFGKRKRSIAPNNAQHKSGGFTPPSSEEYKELNLSYSNACSSLGQFTIDTHLDQSRNVVVAQRVNTMLESFFGVGVQSEGVDANKPTEADRNELMHDRLFLGPKMYTLKYTYAGKAAPGFEENTEKNLWTIVDEMLRDQTGRSLVDEVTAKIHTEVEQIKNAGDRDQWSIQIGDLKRQLERDAFKNVATGTGMREEVIMQRRAQVFAQLTAPESPLVKSLWDMVDNNERGGIAYTRKLIESIKDSIENASTGVLGKLTERGKWFDDLSGKINADEIRELEINLGQTRGSSLLSFGNTRQQRAETVLGQLGEALSLWIVAHLQAVACREAHALLTDLSLWLGEKTGYNAKTDEEQWRGFIGTLMAGRKQVEQVMALMRTEIAATRVSMKTEHATNVIIPAPKNVLDAMARETLAAEAKVWAQETFAKYGGKRELFARLATKEGRAELISELRNMALRKMPADVLQPKVNPLFEALRTYGDRSALFKKCLRRAMPWIDANLNGLFVANKDQYSCVIGVGNAKEFEQEFGPEFRKAASSEAGFSADIIQFAETGIPGKLTCYFEFSGLPLTTLRQLHNWRKSYDAQEKNDRKAPVNTSIRKSSFVHPLHPAPGEVKNMELDFRNFLLAIGLGVLRRRATDGSYQITRKGNKLAIGVERLVRLQGIGTDYRDDVVEQVNLQLDKARMALQLCALSVLFDMYTEEAYKARVVVVDEKDRIVSGMGHFVCTRLSKHFRDQFDIRAKGERIEDPAGLARQLREKINQWTDLIDNSQEDGYVHEVGEGGSEKRVVKPEFYDQHWLQGIVSTASSVAPAVAAFGAAPVFAAAPVAPPVPPVHGGSYFVLLNNLPAGPVGISELRVMVMARSVTVQTLVCAVGSQHWVAAGAVPEIEALFIAAAPPAPPAPPAFVPPPPPPPPPAVQLPPVEFHAIVNNQQSGPFSLDRLQALLASGQMTAASLVWKPGMAGWQKVSETVELAGLMPVSATVQPPAY